MGEQPLVFLISRPEIQSIPCLVYTFENTLNLRHLSTEGETMRKAIVLMMIMAIAGAAVAEDVGPG